MMSKIKNLKLPVITGLVLGGLDLSFWIFFLGSWFFGGSSLAEGLMGMMFLHMPSSILLPLFGTVVMSVFRMILPSSVEDLMPQTIFLFIVGIAQYYFIGYFIGWLISKLRRRFGFDKSIPEAESEPKPNRTKTWVLNILYLLFTVLVLQMIADILSNIMLDFEMYKMNYPLTRHYLEAAVFILWLYSAYRIIRHNKKDNAFKNANRALLIIGAMILVIYSGAYIPKCLKTDVPGATSLEGLYARQQAKIFFDNPLEKLIIIKTAITGMDEKNYQVTAYTLFGLTYRTADIEKVSEYEMRLLLNPNMQRLQHEAQTGTMEILNRIKHPWMPRVTYSELIKDGRFSQEKIHGIIPDINDTNSLFFKTDYKEHDVYLLVYLEDAYTNSMRKDFDFEDAGQKPEYIYKTKDIKITKAHQVAVLDSYRIIYNNLPYYMIFDVFSDEEMPTDVDYVWRPDHNIRQDDFRYILKSILGEVSKKNYFDKDLKLSFSYPDNFYIETENLGPNFDIVVTPFAPDDPDRENPEGFIYTSLRMKKVAKGDEYKLLMDYFHEKAQDKELYPNYEERDTEINGNKIKLIKFVFGFSGGLDVNYLLDAGDYILHVSFYNDTLYADEYGEITESIVVASTITEELSARLQTAISKIEISKMDESSLWWNDEDGYSIIVPGIESIEIAKDDGSGADNFAETSFARDVLNIADEVLTAREFNLNERNSSDNETDRQFYDYVRAYEKGDELCVVRVDPDYGSSGCTENMFMCNTIEITCGNDLAGSQAKQRPFLEALDLKNKESVATVISQDDPFYQIGMHGRRAGSAAVLKEEGDSYRVIYIGQEGPPCELMDKERIPASVMTSIGKGACFSDSGYRSAEENNY